MSPSFASPLNAIARLSLLCFFSMILGGANCQPSAERQLCTSDAQCGEGRVCNLETNQCEPATDPNDGDGNNTDNGGSDDTGGDNNNGDSNSNLTEEQVEQNAWIARTSEKGEMPWRFIGIKREPNEDCPSQVGGFIVRELFANDQGTNSGLPVALRQFCLFRSTDTNIGFNPQQPVPTQLAALADANGPLRAIEPDHMGLAGSSQLSTEYQRSFFNATREHGGKMPWLPTGNFTNDKVRLAILDTSPTDSTATAVNQLGRSSHGFGLANIAQDLTCDFNGQCAADITTQMAMPLYYENGGIQEDEFGGGDFGSIGWLAEALFREARQWRNLNTHRHLILNLSLGWSPDFGGLAGQPSTWPADVQAVYHAVSYAHCAGAVVIAAAGNATGGSTGNTGALLPGAWETRPAPGPQACIDFAGADFNDDILNTSADYRPLLYAASGIDYKGDDIAIARENGRARLAAYADHAVVLGTDVDGDGIANFTKAMTGTSVSTTVIASAAAAVWYYAPELSPYEVMNRLYNSGSNLTTSADFCLTGACGSAKRVTVCDAVSKSCDIGGSNCPGAGALPQCEPWTQDPIDTSSFDLVPFDASATATTMEYHEVAGSIQTVANAACAATSTELDSQDGINSGATAQCPDTQEYNAGAKPWTAPQPFGDPCPDCAMSVNSQIIRLAGTTNFGNFTMPTLSIKNNSGVTTNYSLGNLSGTNISISFSNLSFNNIQSAKFSAFGSTGASVSSSLYLNQ